MRAKRSDLENWRSFRPSCVPERHSVVESTELALALILTAHDLTDSRSRLGSVCPVDSPADEATADLLFPRGDWRSRRCWPRGPSLFFFLFFFNGGGSACKARGTLMAREQCKKISLSDQAGGEVAISEKFRDK